MTETKTKYRIYEPYVAARQRAYVLNAIDRNELTFRGSYVGRFERELADLLGVKHAIATCNGTVSLQAIYKHVFDPRKGPVVVPSVTYAATVSQLVLCGLRPLYIDCDDSFRADLDQLEWVFKHHPVSGVVIPQLYGDAPDMVRAKAICDGYGAPLVEDAAEAFLCEDNGRKLGTFGVSGSFSFFANKIITTGEGGAVVTDDAALADRVRSFCNQNHVYGYKHSGPGTNSRMTNLQAAVGCAQLEDASGVVKRKQEIARYYREALRFEAVVPRVEFSSEWMPVFKLAQPTYERFRGHCEERGVETRPAFQPVHLMNGFEGLTPLSLTTSCTMIDRHFILPCHPGLTDQDLSFIASVANDFADAGRE